MSGLTLQEITRLADELSIEDQLILFKYLANRLQQMPKMTPYSLELGHKNLYGIWQGEVPDDIDIDGPLSEIRNEWQKEWPQASEK